MRNGPKYLRALELESAAVGPGGERLLKLNVTQQRRSETKERDGGCRRHHGAALKRGNKQTRALLEIKKGRETKEEMHEGFSCRTALSEALGRRPGGTANAPPCSLFHKTRDAKRIGG